jgi:hypothetical protein
MGAGAPALGWTGGDPPGEEADVRDDCWALLVLLLVLLPLFMLLLLASKSEKLCGFDADAGEELLLLRDRIPLGFGDGPLLSSLLLLAWAESGPEKLLKAIGDGPRALLGAAWLFDLEV